MENFWEYIERFPRVKESFIKFNEKHYERYWKQCLEKYMACEKKYRDEPSQKEFKCDEPFGQLTGEMKLILGQSVGHFSRCVTKCPKEEKCYQECADKTMQQIRFLNVNHKLEKYLNS